MTPVELVLSELPDAKLCVSIPLTFLAIDCNYKGGSSVMRKGW